jgi:hypothetical protein
VRISRFIIFSYALYLRKLIRDRSIIVFPYRSTSCPTLNLDLYDSRVHADHVTDQAAGGAADLSNSCE